VPRKEDIEGVREVRKELARRPVDTSLLMITYHHGVVRFTGQVKAMRGHELDLRAEMELIAKVLRTKPMIKDVVIECILRS
jgi:hypothetical protein